MSKKLDAKKKVAKMLKSAMKSNMKDKLPESLKGKMSVKIIADSPEDLKKGLEDAESLLGDEEGIGSMLKKAFEKRSKKAKKEEE